MLQKVQQRWPVNSTTPQFLKNHFATTVKVLPDLRMSVEPGTDLTWLPVSQPNGRSQLELPIEAALYIATDEKPDCLNVRNFASSAYTKC